jgi:hypothetical protein
MATDNDTGVMPDQIATFHGFIVLVKWAIGFFVFLMSSMYFGLVAGLPLLGWAIVLLGVGLAVFFALSKGR